MGNTNIERSFYIGRKYIAGKDKNDKRLKKASMDAPSLRKDALAMHLIQIKPQPIASDYPLK
ncbi:hypothetical protein [Iodobacter fluviatilis]|uniref:hypothetical protein n=1 Tax=Iodobacter fluviatilis TaxID=537 RepID=UPI000E1BA4DF|nr:hypothetical protein [Iodobacter fluviatilis]